MEWGFSLQIAGLVSGLVLGVLFLAAGLAAGMWLGRRVDKHPPQTQLAAQQVVKTLGGLYRWSSGVAVEFEEYRHEMEQLAERVKSLEGSTPPREGGAAVVGLLTQIAAANERLQCRLDEAESALKLQAEEVANYLSEARTDALTGLPNRRAFDEGLLRGVAESNRYGAPISLLLIDVDYFKGLNDRYGHLAGDAVLAGVAQTLRDALRECDLVARFGGEEFAALLPQTDAAGAGLAAERVRSGVEAARFKFENVAIRVTASCGVAQAISSEEAESLLKRCDEALYSAKRGGRNRAHWHTGEGIVPLVNGMTENERPLGWSAASLPLELSSLDRACHDLRRRLLEVACPH